MGKLIKKTALFISVFLGIFAFNYTLNSHYIRCHPPVFEEGSIAIGDSHIKSGINPAVIGDCANIGQPGEPLFLTYHKLRKVTENHKGGMRRIIVGWGYHSLSGLADTKYEAPDLAPEFLKRSYSLIPLREMRALPLDYKAYWRVLLRNMLLYPKKIHHDYIGHFNPRPHKLAEADPQVAIRRHYMLNDSTPRPFSGHSLLALDNIVRFCESEGIRLVLVGSPLHPDYAGRIPQIYKHGYAHKTRELRQKGVTVLDFQHRPLPDSHFSDHDHLSALGADSLSLWLRQALPPY